MTSSRQTPDTIQDALTPGSSSFDFNLWANAVRLQMVTALQTRHCGHSANQTEGIVACAPRFRL